MPMNIAMPVAHSRGVDYSLYYPNDDLVFDIGAYFNSPGCYGICLVASPSAPADTPDSLWDVYAFTDGFISFQGGWVVLRLPRELRSRAFRAYNSGVQYYQLTYRGPQLRHVVYSFGSAPAYVEDKIRTILADVAHPGRMISLVPNPVGGRPLTLNAFLAAAPGNLEVVVQEFMNGNIELFVQAGDVIGNYKQVGIDIRFLDSCGTLAPATRITSPVVPRGRPINPSYFLYLVRAPANAGRVNMLTAFYGEAPPLHNTHPLDFLFSEGAVTGRNGNLDQILDMAAAHPPKPLHMTVSVETTAGRIIANRAIDIAALGDWHESRNASNPYNTNSPVRWRNYGTQAADVTPADIPKFRTEVKGGLNNRIPSGAAFDHDHTPIERHYNAVVTYWERYSSIFNAVAAAFDVPCDLAIAIACNETAAPGRPWYDPINFNATHEMDVIAMEPLRVAPPAVPGATPAQQALLLQYANLAGGDYPGGPFVMVRNVNLLVPWNGAVQVHAASPLTWADLRQLVNDFSRPPARAVLVSPGMMQTLVTTAADDIQWLKEIYGENCIREISITHNDVVLTADDPPGALGDIFADWFGVAVDADGNNTNVAADVDAELTRMKRALHNIIAGSAHIKRSYNTVLRDRRGRLFNLICDYDLPTQSSGYNDSAEPVPPAAAGDSDNDKWKYLFALRFYDYHYPRNVPKYFNAAVSMFNALLPDEPVPDLRLWKQGG